MALGLQAIKNYYSCTLHHEVILISKQGWITCITIFISRLAGINYTSSTCQIYDELT